MKLQDDHIETKEKPPETESKLISVMDISRPVSPASADESIVLNELPVEQRRTNLVAVEEDRVVVPYDIAEDSSQTQRSKSVSSQLREEFGWDVSRSAEEELEKTLSSKAVENLESQRKR